MADIIEMTIPTSGGEVTDKGYYCAECGTPLADGRSTFCDDHKPKRNTNKPARKAGKTSTVTASKASGTFAKLIVVITAMYAWSQVRRLHIPDPDGELSEQLAMTDEEAAAVAKPIARFAVSNSTTARIIGPIVENDDIIDALFSIWEYQKRTSAVLAQYTEGTTIPARARRNNVTTGTDEPGEDDSGEPGIVGYDATHDYSSLV